MTKRKLLAIITSFAMVSQTAVLLTASAADGADRVVIDSVVIENDTINSASLTVSENGAYTAYAAVYNADGTLSGINTIDITETDTLTFDGLSFSDGQSFKLMVWDEDMKPAAKMYTAAAEAAEEATEAATEQATEAATEQATEAAAEGYVVTFDTDEHASVTVYDTQDTTTGGTENAATAYARDGSTGDILTDGNGQVNFVVTVDEGYEIESVSADANYKNLKQIDSTSYRITKITGDVNVTITTKESSSEEQQEGDGIIHLSGDSIDATGITGATVSGTTVTLTDNAAAYDSAAAAYVYNIEGTLTDGQIIVAASDKSSEIVLNLDKVSVTSSTGNALDATNGKVTLANASGSTSTFISTYSYTDTDGSTAGGAGIQSKNDLTIKGADSSTKIVAKSTYGNGIRCKADLEIGAGDIEVTAGNNGIKGDESIKFTKKAGNITVTSTGDAIKTDAINSSYIIDTATDSTTGVITPKGTITINGGTFDLTAGGDGIQADNYLIAANSPSVTIKAGTEGIKVNTTPADCSYTDENGNTQYVSGYIEIKGGTFDITSDEDGIKAADHVNVTDGTIKITSALDGIQSGVDYLDGTTTLYTNGNINITGGEFTIKTNGGTSGSTTTNSCKGIKAVTDLSISGGSFNINSYDDAIHSNYTIDITGGTFEIASADDGVHADYWLTMGTEGGADDDYTMNISTSYEALEGSVISYLSGTTTLYSTDDGVNAAGDYEENGTYHGTTTASTNELQIAAGPGGGPGGGGWNPGGGNQGPGWGDDDTSSYGMLYIKGGKLYLRAQGDGLDSNGSALMSGGTVVVAGTTQGGNGVFDKGDASGSYFRVTGGTLIGFGTTDMQDNPTVSGQGYMSTTTSLTKGTLKNIKLNSSEYIGIIPEITLSNALMFVTTPEMTSGSGSVYSGSVSYTDSEKLVGRTVNNTWYGAYKK